MATHWATETPGTTSTAELSRRKMHSMSRMAWIAEARPLVEGREDVLGCATPHVEPQEVAQNGARAAVAICQCALVQTQPILGGRPGKVLRTTACLHG